MTPSLDTLKVAPASSAVAELIRRRWSPRAFDATRPVAADTLHTLFEAASWAPSSSNEQPWLFAYAHRADAEFGKFLACLVPANQVWAKDAAVLVLALARTTTAATGKPNAYAAHDTGAATTTLLLQATEMSLHGHVMAGFDKAKARVDFELPESVEPLTLIALGYLGDADALAEPLKGRELAPRTRKPVHEFAFQGKPVW